MFVTLLRRDLSLIARSPALWLPVMFFVLAAARLMLRRLERRAGS